MLTRLRLSGSKERGRTAQGVGKTIKVNDLRSQPDRAENTAPSSFDDATNTSLTRFKPN
jgi:hypothetical protein